MGLGLGLGLGVGVRDGDRVRCPARAVRAVLDTHTQLDQCSVAQLVAGPHQGGGTLGRGTHLVRVGGGVGVGVGVGVRVRARIRAGVRARVRVRVRVKVRVGLLLDVLLIVEGFRVFT